MLKTTMIYEVEKDIFSNFFKTGFPRYLTGWVFIFNL